MRKEKKENLRGPVSTLIIMILGAALLSLILSILGVQGYKTSISNGVLEDSMVRVRNILSTDGFRYLIGNTVTNFRNFEPLVLLIISLLGIGICEKSGFLNTLFSPLKRVKFGVIVYITIFISLISTVLGEYSYVFLIPFTGVMYKYLDRNPILGILICFLSITLGYGTGLIWNYNDYNLGLLTQAAATVDVDPNYVYNLPSILYVMIASTFILSFMLFIVINRFLVPKFPIKARNDEDLIESKKGFSLSLLSGLLVFLVVVYMILDLDIFGAGILLDKSADNYVAKLFSPDAPFREGLPILISCIMMVTGFVYGKSSGNIKNSSEYSLGLSKSFENLGLLFVLTFFLSQLIAILDWSNIGVIVATNLISFVSKLQFSGVLLIITILLVIIVMSILIPDTLTKWEIASPVIVPLFMRSNITPSFAQFIFKTGDAIGKAFSPIFTYFIVTLAFLQKYNTDERKQISVFGVFKLMLPTLLLITVFWIVFVALWFLIGFPIGPGAGVTL